MALVISLSSPSLFSYRSCALIQSFKDKAVRYPLTGSAACRALLSSKPFLYVKGETFFFLTELYRMELIKRLLLNVLKLGEHQSQ